VFSVVLAQMDYISKALFYAALVLFIYSEMVGCCRENGRFAVRGEDLKMKFYVLVLAKVIISTSFCVIMAKRMQKIY
jgi:hypothetical protein